MSNYFVQELVLYRHFMLIDSPIPFELIANPTNFRKDEHGNVLNTDLSEITGRDICSRPAGAWRVDCWTLLPEKYHKQNPVFTMLIKYDKDLLEDDEFVDVRYSDIDIGEGIAGVNGQLVDVPASAFRTVVNAIDSASASLGDKLDELRTVFNSPASAGGSTPWGSILTAIESVKPCSFSRVSSASALADGVYFIFASASINKVFHHFRGLFVKYGADLVSIFANVNSGSGLFNCQVTIGRYFDITFNGNSYSAAMPTLYCACILRGISL